MGGGELYISTTAMLNPAHTHQKKESKPPVAESKAFRCQPGRKSQQAPQKKCTAMQFSLSGHKISSTGRSEVKTAKWCIVILYRSCAVRLDCKGHIQSEHGVNPE